MDRQVEIENLVLGFRAEISNEITAHRQHRDAVGIVDAFAARLLDHKARYQAKLDAIRAQEPGTAALLDRAAEQIAQNVADEIARVRAAGVVEFAA